MREKVEFSNNGLRLSGALEKPEGPIRCYALFVHCFTCGKDVAAASRISRALTDEGIAVLRFDFTGLGNSDGDFSNTNFSSNLQDILAACDFLRDHYEAPALLVGHSLGGAAVLAVAADVPETKAVVSIGAPHRADHVAKNFAASMEEILSKGEAQVNLGGRAFNIKKQFLEDLDRHERTDLGSLRRALLVMHAPLDETVSIVEAEKIYLEARHPKSFISLDDADHLLSRKADSKYVGRTIAAWVDRYLPATEQRHRNVSKGQLLVEELDHNFTQHINSDSHYWLADEPLSVGGKNAGPDPYEHLLAALGACTSMTLRMYAGRKSLALENIAVELRHSRDYHEDCQDCEEKPGQIEVLERVITLRGNLSEAQRQRMLQIADRCPVHRTLHNAPKIRTVLSSN